MSGDTQHGYAFREHSGRIDLESIAESPEHVRDQMIRGVMGWRYDHPDRYDHDDMWNAICTTGEVVRVSISVTERPN